MAELDYKNLLKRVIESTPKKEVTDERFKIPKADVCFMFKLIDPLERGKGHKLSEEIIKNLKSKYIIASFASKTISHKPMKYPYRGWIERMLDRLQYKWEKINTASEVYYIIQK